MDKFGYAVSIGGVSVVTGGCSMSGGDGLWCFWCRWIWMVRLWWWVFTSCGGASLFVGGSVNVAVF